MISKRRDCRLMMSTTVLHGGVLENCHRASTQHKSRNKIIKGDEHEAITDHLGVVERVSCFLHRDQASLPLRFATRESQHTDIVA